MQDRPTALELLEAVREFLSGEVAPELQGRKAFHMRVVLNALGILERELELEEDIVRDEHRALAGLLGAGSGEPSPWAALRDSVRAMNANLARAIRAGDMDDRWDETLQTLQRIVAGKLRVANPGYRDS